MRDVWIYGESRQRAGAVGASLGELGFGARYLGTGGRPLADGAALGRPLLAVVVGVHELVEQVRAGKLSDVGLLLVLAPDELASCPALAAVDELLVEPFTLDELEARVERATHRADAGGRRTIRAGSLELDPATYQAAIDDDPVDFTYMEFELLRFLMTHPNRVFSREALLQRVWGYDYFGGARTVDVHIRRVRAKLGDQHADRVKTVRSVGYLFELPAVRPGAAPLRSVV